MDKKIVVAVYKPFAEPAKKEMRTIAENEGFELVINEYDGDKENLKEIISDANGIIVRSDKITEEIIDSTNNLEIIVRAGAGYDNVDTEYAKNKQIPVFNCPGQNSNAVAELAFGMMLYIARNKFTPKSGRELRNKSLGIHAFGHVGRFVAKIAQGFGMKVYAHDPFVDKKDIKKVNVTPVEKVQELYSKCDYISVHLPSNEKTKNFVNYNLLKNMKKNSTLVNTARKAVICDDGIVKMLQERDDFSYITDLALDEDKKIKEKYPERYFSTPKKMGAQTLEANINTAKLAVKNIINYYKKNDETYRVN